MNHSQHADPDSASVNEALSAWCDGWAHAGDVDCLVERSVADASLIERCQTYQIIGDVLRGAPAAASAAPSAVFLASFRQRLAQDGRLEAASAAPAPEPTSPAMVRGGAANDPVFRWKLVSGLASLAAVMAVGWNLVASNGPAANGAASLASLSAVPVATAPASPAETVRPLVVSTQQGRLIRDAALERLLADHRQHGSMSAFQTSTGFIRNATYDANAR